MRSPEAIAAEAEAQVQARAAQAQAAAVRAGLRAYSYEAAQEAVAGGEARESNAAIAEQSAEPEPEREPGMAGVADAVPVVEGEREGSGVGEVANNVNTVPPEQRTRAAEVDAASPD